MNRINLIHCPISHINPANFTKRFWLIIYLFLSVFYSTLQAQGLSPYSTRELETLEKEFIQQINLSNSVERNPLANQYINNIGKRLARTTSIPKSSFFLVKSPEVNAFAGPGGYIGINSQLILTTTNESELAAVMAHELAHVRLHHLYGKIEHQKQMRIPMLASLLAAAALGAVNPSMGMGAMMASLSGFSQDNINFTRANEKEADSIGISMLIKAGFNPRGMSTFFKKMQETTRYYYTDNIPAILRTHPMDFDRIAEAENRMPANTAKQSTSSLDYALFKEIIRNATTSDTRRLLDYYTKLCPKQNPLAACQYGHALALLNTNDFHKAQTLLQTLSQENKDNLYYQTALAQTELGLALYPQALDRLLTLHNNYPDNYAALMSLGQGFLTANQAEKATSLLLKGSRLYPQDLALCQTLAQAQAQAHQKAYAYFTQAQCLVLTGQSRAAIAQLKVAANLAKKDAYLIARINAKIDEIKYQAELEG